MTKLRVSAQARRDLHVIGKEGRGRYGRSAPEAHIEGFRRLFAPLRDQPFAGQEWPDLELGIRSLAHRPHRILYRVVHGTVGIDRIIHQAHDLRRTFPVEQ